MVPRFRLSLALALSVVAMAVPRVRAAEHPDLTGTWVLNKDRSDALEDVDPGKPPTRIGSAPGVGGSGPMSGAGVNGPLMGGSKVDPVLVERMRELAHLAFDAPDELVVTAEGDMLRMVGDQGRVTRLTPDGSKVEELAGVLSVERRTRWDKQRLVTEIKAKDGGGEAKRIYSRDGSRLLIEAVFDAEVASRTQKLKLVYDRKDR